MSTNLLDLAMGKLTAKRALRFLDAAKSLFERGLIEDLDYPCQ